MRACLETTTETIAREGVARGARRSFEMDDGLERACVERARAWVRGRRRRRRRDDVDDDDDFDFDDDGAARVEAWRAIVREERAKRRKVCGGDDDAREVEEEEEDEDVRGMSEDEVERVLLAMQEATARELEREETARAVRVREDLEREEAEENERLARAVEAFERWTFPGDDGGGGGGGGEGGGGRGEEARETRGVGDDEEDVLCPVCATRRVMMNRHVLFCACGGFRITRADEKVGLAYLRRRLAETFDAHGDRGCGRPSELRFDVRDAYGLDACVATCASCDFLEIVM